MYEFGEPDGCPSEEFEEETFSERFWGAFGMIPYSKQVFNVAGAIKNHFTISVASQYYRNIIWWTTSTATVLFLPIFIDKPILEAVTTKL